MDSKYDEPPSAKALDEGYNQTYLIMAKDEHSAEDIGHEVLFRCGNWCYKGLVQFNELRINLEDVPVVIPTLQRQQGSLRYYCTAKSIPASSEFFGPMGFMEEALEFVAQELTSEAVEKELIKMSAVFPWIEDDAAATYFELAVNELPACMEKVRLVASKTYTRGLVLIAIYHNSHVYVILQAGEGEQPLLDVRFPDVSKHNQGILVNSYSSGDYRKLTLWHNTSSAVASGGAASALGNAVRKDLPKLKTINLSSANYEQTYVILHSSMDAATSSLSSYHDVLFRFGSWCYAGRVQLTPSLALYDIPYVIPALRMQQSRLDYVSDVAALPITSPFAAVLEYLRSVQEALESVLLGAEDAIAAAVATSSEEGAFFEFSLSLPAELRSRLSNVEMVVSKVYHPSGLVAISVFYQSAVYVTLQDSSKGEHPLLDSRFPMLQANRDRDEPQGLSCPSSDEDAASRPPTSVGYVLKHFEAGVPSWRELRKLTLWLSPDEPASNGPLFAAEAKSSSAEPSSSGAKGGSKRDLDRSSSSSSGSGSGSAAKEVAEQKPPSTHTLSPLAPLGPDAKSDAKNPAPSSPIYRQALPHHIPKMADPLVNRLENIRSAMGDEGLRAPWDLKGKPLGKLSQMDFK